jgi:uncharacterized protein YndB with AHSA1/START domain
MTTSSKNELKVTLPSDTQILWDRSFDAPRQLVFDALTQPEHLKHWMSGHGFELSEVEADLRPGGAYRWLFRNDKGDQMQISGEYREVTPPERLVNTTVWGDTPDIPEMVQTMVLEEREGRTYIALTIDFASKEARDAAIATGMADGAQETYRQLDEYLKTMP